MSLVFAGPAHAGIFAYVEPKTGLTILSNMAPVPASVQAVAPASLRSLASGPGATIAPGQFPRVSAQQQKERDAGRRVILLDELVSEQQALKAATARGATANVLNRHLGNIAALQRELQGTR